ncbi:MAG: ABC transporter substrate-binding protein [Clostridia bacterium]|nr:ABC transporter substrate-binding protein [Clostridia bacterium]
MKKLIAIILSIAFVCCMFTACGKTPTDGKKTYKIGICNFVDDASLNQICDNIKATFAAAETDEVKFEVLYDNCNTDSNVMSQIIANFIASGVDLMIGIATPVAMQMQAATEDNKIPVVFAAVSDPVACDVVDTLEVPGANITGTSDYLDTNAIMNLIFAQNPSAKKIGLLYDLGQDSSTTSIAAAKEYLNKKGVEIIEKTGTNVPEIELAADALIAANVDAIFTPSDNTVMTAELSIYEKLAAAKIPHYAGADSFALNGAFCGYGVDYANLGVETAKMAIDILTNGKDVSKYPVKTFDNGTATVNTDICEILGINYEDIVTAFTPYCTKVQSIKTAESFN